jgi:hypothetical protein
MAGASAAAPADLPRGGGYRAGAASTVPAPMDFALDLLQGLGLAAAAGISPFLPVLLAGVLARSDLGLDFDGTPVSFLERPGFLLGVVIALVVLVALRRRAPGAGYTGRSAVALGALAVALGALESGGSLDDRQGDLWLGLVVGVPAAALAFAATRALLHRTAARLDAGTRGALPVYADGAALALAGLSVLAPPVSVLALGLLAWLLVAGRRRRGEKYAGLRILR